MIEQSDSSRCSTAKRCEYVYELEDALSFVTDECRLSEPVIVTYEMRDGEGFMRVQAESGCTRSKIDVATEAERMGIKPHDPIIGLIGGQ
jgi:hypothetical protein